MSHGDRSGLYGVWSSTSQRIDRSMSWRVTVVIVEHDDTPREHTGTLSFHGGADVSAVSAVGMCVGDVRAPERLHQRTIDVEENSPVWADVAPGMLAFNCYTVRVCSNAPILLHSSSSIVIVSSAQLRGHLWPGVFPSSAALGMGFI